MKIKSASHPIPQRPLQLSVHMNPSENVLSPCGCHCDADWGCLFSSLRFQPPRPGGPSLQYLVSRPVYPKKAGAARDSVQAFSELVVSNVASNSSHTYSMLVLYLFFGCFLGVLLLPGS